MGFLWPRSLNPPSSSGCPKVNSPPSFCSYYHFCPSENKWITNGHFRKILDLKVWIFWEGNNQQTTLTGLYLMLWTQPTIQQGPFHRGPQNKNDCLSLVEGSNQGRADEKCWPRFKSMSYFCPLNSLCLSPFLSVSILVLPVKEWLLRRCDSVGSLRLPLTASQLSNGCRGK